jgi:GDP-fucose transporter C1
VFGVVSSACVALYSILVKRSLALASIDNNHWRLLAYNSTIAVPLMLPLALWQEWDGVQRSTALRDAEFWIAMLAASALAVLISVATFMQINYSSALTNNISGTVKAAVQTVLAVLVFGNEITVLNAVGIAMVIGGSAWYSHLRYTEMQAPAPTTATVNKKV